MFAIQNAVRHGLVVSRQAGQCRTLLVAPPKNRVPLYERVAFGICIAIGVLFTPAWIACHFKVYTGKEPQGK